tara:strand:+ start:289 stop:1035 length:747 start_codon:yes stop_codon:yes gene_type:complete
MGVFGKSFFNFPPANPEDPGFAQDSNRSLTEAHSTGKEIADLLSHYDEETITSLDGAKYQVMAQREGSGVASDTWWSPSINLEEMTLGIAAGALTAPWDDRTGDSASGSILHPRGHYRYFTFPAQAEVVLQTGWNYFFINANFTERTFTEAISIPTSPSPHELEYTNYFYHVTGVGDFSLIRETVEFPQEDDLTGKGQILGWYNITEEGGKKKVADHKWRTGHVIDFRSVPGFVILGQTTATTPSSPN